MPKNVGQPARALQNLQLDPGRHGLPTLAAHTDGLCPGAGGIGVQVGSSVALHTCSYEPCHITHGLHVETRLRWMARDPSFSNKVQTEQEQELELGPFSDNMHPCAPGHMYTPLALHG